MKTLFSVTLICIALLLVTSCAPELTQFPTAPTIKKHYMIEVKGQISVLNYNGFTIENVDSLFPMTENEVARCLEFDVVTWMPYKIKFLQQVPLSSCNLIGGYQAGEIQAILNFISDVYAWADKKKHCFKGN